MGQLKFVYCVLSSLSLVTGTLEDGKSDSEYLLPQKYKNLITFYPQSCR